MILGLLAAKFVNFSHHFARCAGGKTASTTLMSLAMMPSTTPPEFVSAKGPLPTISLILHQIGETKRRCLGWRISKAGNLYAEYRSTCDDR